MMGCNVMACNWVQEVLWFSCGQEAALEFYHSREQSSTLKKKCGLTNLSSSFFCFLFWLFLSFLFVFHLFLDPSFSFVSFSLSSWSTQCHFPADWGLSLLPYSVLTATISYQSLSKTVTIQMLVCTVVQKVQEVRLWLMSWQFAF